MRAMVLERPGTPLMLKELCVPQPLPHEILIEVEACAVCRTDLHILDNELQHPHLPLILGHQIIGQVAYLGSHVTGFEIGERVGVPWLGGCCDSCRFCLEGRENLCDQAVYTGYQHQGGFAEYCTADYRFAITIPTSLTTVSSEHLSPLLCGGLIGYRALRMAGQAKRIGFYGFGSAAHILLQIAKQQGRDVYVFTKQENDHAAQLAKNLGAAWTGNSLTAPPIMLDAAIIFAPAGELVLEALKAIDKGGSVICAGIHMSDIPSIAYHYLWQEKMIRSVTNLTRQDATEFFNLVSTLPIQTHIKVYPLKDLNCALLDLKDGNITGTAVINPKI